jgi:hypothetical protein
VKRVENGMPVVIVAGALANKPGNAGGAWERLSWVVGLRRLGCDVYFVEQVDSAACGGERRAWFRAVTGWFGVVDRSSLVTGAGQCEGLSWSHLLDVAAAADLLVNLSGQLTLAPILDRVRRTAYVDVDPGYTQIWHADPATPFAVARHDFYFTIGENIGSPDCPIPTGGLDWRPIRQPVVLADWPVTGTDDPGRFTTVASWRGAFGPVSHAGQTYGLKVHEFRKVIDLPRRSPHKFEIALDIHPADAKDRDALVEHGWRLVDPAAVAADPDAFRRYVQSSGAEFSVSQGVYAGTNSGWFSDRTVRYLASGKPVLVQDTGFGRHLPVGEGLLAFRTVDEAVAGADVIVRDYDRHCRAARAIAERFFDSDKVLTRLLREVGVA